MCPVTLTSMAVATGTALASAASATTAAASAVGSAIATGVGAIGSGIGAIGGTVGGWAATGASALGASAGASAATGTVVGGITEGAIVGGALGTATGMGGAAITGGDIGKGALTGLWTGAASGAALGGLGSIGDAVDAANLANQVSPQELSTMTGTGDLTYADTSFMSDVTGQPVQMLDQGKEASLLLMSKGAPASNPMSPGGMALQAKTGVEAVGGAAAGGASGIDWKAAGVAGMQLAGGGVQAYGAYQEGKQNAANLKAQAENLNNEKRAIEESAETEAKDLARRQRQLVGKGKVAAAANGVMLEGRAESSPAMWEQDAAAELAWDQSKLFHNARLKTDILSAQQAQYYKMASNARKTGNLRAATSLLTSAANAGVGYYGMTSRYA